jgi:hypothetical protein
MRIFSMTGALSTSTIRFLRTEMLEIREASETDFDKISPIFQVVASAGDSYAYPADITKAEGKRLRNRKCPRNL